MKKIIFFLILIFLITGCQQDNHREVMMVTADLGIDYVMDFSDVFDDLEIYNIEYMRNEDNVYITLYYRGKYSSDIDVLNIVKGDILDSKSVCEFSVKTYNYQCLNGADVTSGISFSEKYQNMFQNKLKYYYYQLTQEEIQDLME